MTTTGSSYATMEQKSSVFWRVLTGDHRPHIDMDGDVMIINPGSLSYPRQEGRRPTYIMMEIDGSGKVDFTLNYV